MFENGEPFCRHIAPPFNRENKALIILINYQQILSLVEDFNLLDAIDKFNN